jgi:hypothetical protein
VKTSPCLTWGSPLQVIFYVPDLSLWLLRGCSRARTSHPVLVKNDVPLEIRFDGDLWLFGISRGARIFVDQATQDRFSEDPFAVEVGNGAVCAFGDALGDALVRPGGVVVHLVFGQDGTQMALSEDQHAVQELTAQGAGETLADRVHPRSPDGGAQDPGASSLEDRIERGCKVRSAIADEEPDVPEPLTKGESKVAGLLHCPLPGGVPRCIRRVPCSMNTSTYSLFSSTVPT